MLLETLPTVRCEMLFPEGPETTPAPRRVYLYAGQVFSSAAPALVTTVLGSCVAVCLTDRAAGVGGVNHFSLPHPAGAASSARFGSVAVPRLIEEVLAAGAQRGRLEAKVFGGACLLPESAARGDHLGAQNVRLAFRLLWNEGIAVLAEDVEGRQGRRVLYHTSSGVAWVRRL